MRVGLVLMVHRQIQTSRDRAIRATKIVRVGWGGSRLRQTVTRSSKLVHDCGRHQKHVLYHFLVALQRVERPRAHPNCWAVELEDWFAFRVAFLADIFSEVSCAIVSQLI